MHWCDLAALTQLSFLAILDMLFPFVNSEYFVHDVFVACAANEPRCLVLINHLLIWKRIFLQNKEFDSNSCVYTFIIQSGVQFVETRDFLLFTIVFTQM